MGKYGKILVIVEASYEYLEIHHILLLYGVWISYNNKFFTNVRRGVNKIRKERMKGG